MKQRILTSLIVLLIALQLVNAQNKWGTQGRYLTKNGKQIYLSGANYIVSDGWMINLPNLSVETMNADMAALQNIEINHIRFFPLWTLTQPSKDKVNEKVLKQLDLLVESAGKHNISMQIAPITGWMSGLSFLPAWAAGDIFRDQTIIDGEKFLATNIATRYRNNPAVLGYDFGNELNVLASKTSSGGSTPDQIFSWMKQIYQAFKVASPDQLTTDGIGTGYDANFDIRNIAQTADYLAPHSYPYFHGTSFVDPWYGQRSTYSSNFIMSWCEMVGKPVIIQEIGCSESWLPESKISAYLRLNYLSTWADGAAGFLWWSSHNIDTALASKTKSLPDQPANTPELKFSELEYSLGLLATDNKPKDYALTYRESIKTVNKLGLTWTDEVPVCYILIPSTVNFVSSMLKYISAYVMAKQNHFDVKLLYEGKDIPSDATALIVPGIKLNGHSKDVVQTYLVNGGKVYQSYENDFGTAITTGSDTILNNVSLRVINPVGLMESAEPVIVPEQIPMHKTLASHPARNTVSAHTGSGVVNPRSGGNSSVFVTQAVGRGIYYYLAYNLEAALAKIYNPWPDTNCELFYSALKPRTSIDIDNKYVELYIKKSRDRRIILLLNHSEEYQNVTVKSINSLKFSNFETREKVGTGKEITLTLRPAQVIILNVQ